MELAGDASKVTIKVTGYMPTDVPAGRFDYTSTYTVAATGAITVDSHWRANPVNPSDEMPPLPRVGVLFQVPTTVQQVTWYGHGPHENYPDRLKSSPVGIHTASLGELHTDYIKPQENGGRGGIRWAALQAPAQGGNGAHGLLLTSQQRQAGKFLHTSLSRYTINNLLTARHTKDLVPTGYLTWCVDCAVAGLGGDDSWSPRTHPEYQLKDEEYWLTFTLTPYLGTGIPRL